MTLQQAAQILGGTGVIASLIYVAIQIRNNTRAVRAAAYQQLSGSISSLWEALSRDGELCSILMRGGDDFGSLDRIEKVRFRFVLMAYMRRFENAWFQHNIGILREKDWQAMGSDLESMCSMPGIRAAWPLIKNRSNADVRAFVDAVVTRAAAANAD